MFFGYFVMIVEAAEMAIFISDLVVLAKTIYASPTEREGVACAERRTGKIENKFQSSSTP